MKGSGYIDEKQSNNGAEKSKSCLKNDNASNSGGCYKCGFRTKIAMICDTSNHLVDVYMQSIGKGKRLMETNVKLISLDITRFPGG